MNGKIIDQKITFGIITDGSVDSRIYDIINSIQHQKIPRCEVIVVGGNKVWAASGITTLHIPFKEITKNGNGWITRKKNLITENAKYDIIVYMHDYLKLAEGWYKGFCKFCIEYPDWDVAMNCINNQDDSRYRDWVIWDDPDYKGFPQTALPSYDYNKTQFMYVSGAYWVAKKYVMEDIPLNEKLFWCEGEDVEWSLKMREKYKYVFNPYSFVDMLKYKDVISRRCY